MNEAPQEATGSSESADNAFRGFRMVSLLTLVSRVFGMVRDAAMAGAFGAGPVMDAFSVAFRIPNLARRLFGEGAQTSAFLPAYIRTQSERGTAAANQLAGGMFGALAVILILLVALAEATLAVCWWTVPLSAETRLLVELLALLLPYVILICLAAQQSAVLHAARRFGWPALLPIVLNLLWLAAIPVVFAVTPAPDSRMRWLCAAIFVAGTVQLAIPMAVVRQHGVPWLDWNATRGPEVRRVFRSMGPILLGVTVTQINTLFDSLLAWGLSVEGSEVARLTSLPALPSGTASALYFGQRMYQFPLGIIGVALGTVIFPLLTRHAARGERDLLRSDLTSGLGLTLSIGIPAGVGLMILARPVTALLFERGEFNADDADLTSSMIVAYGAAVWAFMAILVMQRGYYALDDRLTPLKHGLVAMAVNLALDLILLYPLGGAGLAWATALAAMTQAILSARGLSARAGLLDWNALARTLGKTIAATALMTLACLLARQSPAESFGGRLIETFVPVSAGVAAYFLAAWGVNLPGPWRLIRRGRL